MVQMCLLCLVLLEIAHRATCIFKINLEKILSKTFLARVSKSFKSTFLLSRFPVQL